MTLEDYRLECQWTKNEMASRAGITFDTLNRVYQGQSISMRSASKLVSAISLKLGRKVKIMDISDLKVQ